MQTGAARAIGDDMSKIQVFDPPMCCPTGACGPNVDSTLPRFAADLDSLKSQGVFVERFNLAQQPGEFAKHQLVKKALAEQGNECLPLILVDGRVTSTGKYPTRSELAAMAGVSVPATGNLWSPAVEELVAIGASIACNCMPCLKYHTDKARSLGVSDEDMAKAVAMAEKVKQTPTKLILDLANRYLNGKVEGAPEPQACCTGSTNSTSDSKCCG
jgi:AhpD family alkylhydroperoxidase